MLLLLLLLRAAIERPVDLTVQGTGLVYDLLWADPSPNISHWSANPRGVSFLFGLEAAREVMQRCGVRTLVRVRKAALACGRDKAVGRGQFRKQPNHAAMQAHMMYENG